MRLHEERTIFDNLISLTSRYKGITSSAVKRDYYMVLLLEKLSSSEYSEKCVFKGGTSLSKCYEGVIERFSEDIDITYLGIEENDNFVDKTIKKIEKTIVGNAFSEKISDERSQRSKSIYIWFENEEDRIKLEIGSNVKPEPYSKRKLKSYIHEYLEKNNLHEEITMYGLKEIELNVLNIERTFIDKVMAVKRHALQGNIANKVRHIYDVVKLYQTKEIQTFITDRNKLKNIVRKTKETDSYYLIKRKIKIGYNLNSEYNFESWKHYLNKNVRYIYEHLHETLLYTNKKQDFNDAIKTLKCISDLFKEIEE